MKTLNSAIKNDIEFEEEVIAMKIDSRSAGHIIRRLTDLYSNPVEASVREIVSNAIDTVMNLNKEDRLPIQINLPNVLNKTFTVQDFGEGMSKQDITEIYSQYGASTKTNATGQIGAYGLGAKSPLSYCSQFTVESTKDGVTTELIVSSESGGNYTRFITHENKGLPDGTKVSIPVRENDINKFSSATETYRKFMLDVEMKIDGDAITPGVNYLCDISLPELGEDFSLRLFSSCSKEELFGQVFSGEINTNLNYFLSGWDYSDAVRNYDKSLYLELIPGVMNFSSSRDEITKDKRFETINDLLTKRVSPSLDDLVSKELSSSKDDVNIYRYIYSALLSWRGARKERDFLEKFITSDGTSYLSKIEAKGCERVDLEFAITKHSNGYSRPAYSALIGKDNSQTLRSMPVSTIKENGRSKSEYFRANVLDLLQLGNRPTELAIITEMTEDGDLMKAINRIDKLDLMSISGSHITVIGTKMTKDEITKALKGKIEFNHRPDSKGPKFFTINELVEGTRATKKPKTKNAGISQSTDIYSPTELLLLRRTMIMNYQTLDLVTKKANVIPDDNATIKFLIIHKNARSSFDSKGFVEFMLSKVKTKDDVIQLTQIRATGTPIETIKHLTSKFDYVIEAENVKYDTKEIEEYVEDNVVLAKFTPERLRIKEDSPLWGMVYFFSDEYAYDVCKTVTPSIEQQQINSHLREIMDKARWHRFDSKYLFANLDLEEYTGSNEDSKFFVELSEFCTEERWLSDVSSYSDLFRDEHSEITSLIIESIVEVIK